MVYVDPLMNHGWKLRGKSVKSCHLFADSLDELFELADKIGLKRSWFQDNSRLQHFDITESKRIQAIEAGAVELDKRESVLKYKELRDVYKTRKIGRS